METACLGYFFLSANIRQTQLLFITIEIIIQRNSNFVISPPGDGGHDQVPAVSEQIIERESDEEAEVTSDVHQELDVAKH